jgi:hypothetical protein
MSRFFLLLCLLLLDAAADEVARIRFLRVPVGGGGLVTDPKTVQAKAEQARVLGVTQDEDIVKLELECHQASDWIECDAGGGLKLWSWQTGWKPWQLIELSDGGAFWVLVIETQSACELVLVPVSEDLVTYCVSLCSERLRLKYEGTWYKVTEGALLSLKTQGDRETLQLTSQRWDKGEWKPCWMRSFSVRADQSRCIILFDDHGVPCAQVLSL